MWESRRSSSRGRPTTRTSASIRNATTC